MTTSKELESMAQLPAPGSRQFPISEGWGMIERSSGEKTLKILVVKNLKSDMTQECAVASLPLAAQRKACPTGSR